MINLPGIWVLVGGLWVANLYYWGFNQYIIQRTLAAKSLRESQKGIALAAFLKILIPFIVVLPGIACYVMVNDPSIMARLGDTAQLNIPTEATADKAYPWLLQLLPSGLKGIAFAALAAAIVSSLASMLNSTSTIFIMDIYKTYINRAASDSKLVSVGRITAAIALIIACIMAPLLGGIDQAFQFIQEYTGIVSPGILGVFLLGLFWKQTTNKAAIRGAILSVPIALVFKAFPEIPWMNQMGLTAVFTILIIMILSYIENKGRSDHKGIIFHKGLFKTGPAFNISAFVICIILAVLYAVFW
uniref:MS114, putative Na+/glucose symporter subunit n=1 Tax=Microscilla sp. PRE1 TaxID=155537 RepID=Q93PB5_9BACT|nr:MS114, putative Na+/glucose symporter subunit [Microscilla sp. PRE1]